MLFTPFIFHPQLVVRRRADHVTGAVLLRHMVNMPRVMQRMGDIGPVGVAFMECYRHFRALNEREVKTVHVAAVGFGETYRHALLALRLVIPVGVKFHPVQSGCILPGVDIVGFCAGDTRRHRPGHLRARQQRRTPAHRFAVRYRQQGHPQGIFAAGAKTRPGD
ncbi:hypothetical protein ENINMM144B1_23745 [Enterobacter intestinihominis]